VGERLGGWSVGGVLSAIGGALIIVGATLPWYRITIDLGSFGDQGSGTIDAGAMQSTALVTAVLGTAVLAAAAWLLTGGPDRGLPASLSAVGVAVVVMTLVSALALKDQQLGGVLQLQGLFGGDEPYTESIGVGVWLTVAGGVACTVAGLAGALASRGPRPNLDPDAPVAETFPISE
jgi:hypothetical protein